MIAFVLIGNGHKNGNAESSINNSLDTDEDMGKCLTLGSFECNWSKFSLFAAEIDPLPNKKSNKSGVERMLEFGRELFQMSQRLEKENGANETNRRMLEVSLKSNNGWDEVWSFSFIYLLIIFRMHLVCWLIRIHGQVRWAGNCAHRDVKQYAQLSIRPY